MTRYAGQTRLLVAVDCIVFGFDGANFKKLLVQHGFTPEHQKWGLMGGFVQSDEGVGQAAHRMIRELTGFDNVYMEQLQVFDNPGCDQAERTVSVAYMALIDMQKYELQMNRNYGARWFPLHDMPQMNPDHEKVIEIAKHRLKYKASMHPILFELLPEKFTIPQLLALYEGLYDTEFDNANFSRKVLSTGILIKQQDKCKENSRKGAFYYKLNREKYQEKWQAFLNLIPKPEALLA